MKEKKWTRLGARVLALSLCTVMALSPLTASAATLNVTDRGGNVYNVRATLKEGLNEKPVTVKVTDEEGNILYTASGTSSAEGAVSVTFDLNGLVKPNQRFEVSLVCDDETTPDEAKMEYITPAASNITLNTPSVDTAAQSAVISGSAQAGMKVTISVAMPGGNAAVEVTPDGSGAFSTTLTSLAYGDYSVSAAYTDTSIGGSGASTSFTIEKPVATLALSASGGENVVTLSLTGEPGATVTASVAGKSQNGTFDASGACAFTFTDVAAGDYTVEVSDSTSQSASASVTVVDKPVTIVQQDIAVTSVTPGAETVAVEGTATPGAQVKISGFGQEATVTVSEEGKYSASFTDVAPGTYNALEVVYVDTATYTGSPASVNGTWAVTKIPAGTQNIIITVANGGVNKIEAAGTAKAGEKLTLKVTEETTGAVVSATVTASSDGKFAHNFTSLAAGKYTVTAAYHDEANGLGAGVPNVTVTDSTTTPDPEPEKVDITVGAVGSAGMISATGTAKAGEVIVLVAKNQSTLAETSIEVTAGADGKFAQTFKYLEAGKYTITAAYKNTSVGAGASATNVSVAGASLPTEKKGISLDKLYETSLTVVGKTSPSCTVTVKVNYSGKEVSIFRMSDSEGVFRIPLPRTMKKHTEITAIVTYADGTTDSTTGHVYAGSGDEEYKTTYKVGSVSNDVYFLEERLQKLGYPITPDRVYDDETARIVRIFQRANGLDVDGIAGPKTLTKLYSVTAVVYSQSSSTNDYIYLERGSRGTLVTQVQNRLKELGYYTIRVDGIFGVGTQSAVRAFQRNNALSVTGVVNKETYTAIMDANAIGVNANTNTTDYVELRQGNRGNAVVRLQARLQALGYYTISVDGIYGSGTRSAVRRFQSRNGISASGIATIYTQQVLFGSSAIANSTSTGTSIGYVYLHYGSNGEAVKRLQTALKNAGYYKGAVDGQYYDQTYAAVKAFQRAVGLDVDGIAGRKTQNALYGTNY